MSRARLQGKWKNFFRMLDEDGDETITAEDFGLKAQRIITSYQLDASQSVRCTQILMRWWTLCQELVGESKKQIKRAEFIEVLSKLYCNEKTRLVKIMTDFSQYLFQLMDGNSDGFVSAEELDTMNQCLGRKNSTLNAAVFEEWDEDEDGDISESEYMNGMVEYLTSDHPDKNYGFVFEYNQENLLNNKKVKK